MSRRTSRRLRTCSPRVRGSKSLALGLRALRRSGTGCKRATRPCPCGYRGVRNADCRCDDAAVAKYVGKLSGPLLDRIDMQVEIARVPFDDMVRVENAEHSATIRERVVAARERQQRRFVSTRITCNAEIPPGAMRRYCALDEAPMRLLALAAARRQFSARALDRIVRVARTIADLAATQEIAAEHVAEAVTYRSLERLDHRAA
ncbi:MAG: magnesium chelatase subunit ChlI family protein [Candidatus Tyrphobacter sp.]